MSDDKTKLDKKGVIGLVLIALGTILGLYVGAWVCFVGGLVDIVREVRSEHLSVAVFGWGIAKVMFAGATGGCVGLLFFVPGLKLIKDQP